MTDYFLFDDALVAPLKTAEMMCQTGRKLSELVSEIPTYLFDSVAFECSDDAKFRFIEKLATRLANEYTNISTMDGLRIGFDDGWILLRASNTSPKVRLYIEATTQERFNELKQKYTTIIDAELRGITE